MGWRQDLAERELKKLPFPYFTINAATLHFRIPLDAEAWVDFWPSTGTWIIHPIRERGVGTEALIKRLKS